MARIKIDDIEGEKPLTEDEVKRVTGGGIAIQEQSYSTVGGDPRTTAFNPVEITISKTVPWKK